MKTYSDKWLEHFRRTAFATRDSVKETTKVSALLIGSDNEVLLTAFNGPAIGVKDTPERRSRTDGLKYKYSSHAERNLISFAAKRGISTEGLTVYATHHPCSGCANALVQAGISCVIVGHGEYISSDGDLEHAQTILRECNVQIIQHKGSESIERADALARAVLLNDYDKLGESTYYHSVRVARLIPKELPDTYRIVALLHDVVEKLGSESLPILASMFGGQIAAALIILTHDKSKHTYKEYIDNICNSENAHAIIVKLADTWDDMDPERAFEIEDQQASLLRRYLKARIKLLDAILRDAVFKSLNIYINPRYAHYDFLHFNIPRTTPYPLQNKINEANDDEV